MRIQTNSATSFKGTPLFPVNIKTKQPDGSFKMVPAHFVELNYSNDIDCDLMRDIHNLWITRECLSNYASSISRNFFKAKTPYRKFFAIQIDDLNKDEYSNTAAIMETSNPINTPKTYLEINFLQSATSIVPGFSPVKARGAGEQAIYGAVKFAKALGLKKIILFSTNDDFYEKIGLAHIKNFKQGSHYGLYKQDFDKFIQQKEEKYK